MGGLDTDSMFPRELEEDPFEKMHNNDSLALGYQHITVTSATSSKNFWEDSLLFLSHSGIDVVKARANKSRFLSNFLVSPEGFEVAPVWNNQVVMTDCEIMRVSFFQPGTRYYEYFEYLDTLGGFWLFRWGDHAVRALGTGLALWPYEEGRLEWPRLAAYAMKTPYAHQGSCFCEDLRLMCVSLGKNASGDPLWPEKKQIWEC